MTDLESQFLSKDRQKSVLTLFHLYRVALTLLLLTMIRLGLLTDQMADISAQQTLSVQILLYLLLAIIGMWLTLTPHIERFAFIAVFVTDVIMLLLIIRVSGGIAGGFGNLLLVSVSVGAVFLPARKGLLLAALATIGLVYSEIQLGYGSQQQYFLQAAMLGIAFFSVTFLIQFLLKRARDSEALAMAHADNIIDLQAVNAMVLDRMRTGIVVCSPTGKVRMINHAAQILMTNNAHAGPMTQAPEELLQHIQDWLQGKPEASEPLRFERDLPDVSLNFAALQPTSDSDVVVFLEDQSNTRQRAQQLKLASLGRLTASIAHEIRNPLGAISHAAQLLEESPSLDPTDNRMLHIIQMHTKRMNNIIENVLQLSRNSKSTPEEFNLAPWLQQFESEYHEIDRQAIFDIRCPDELGINFDQIQLQQVLENLVNNGLRYSRRLHPEGSITLEAGILNANDQPYLDVIDDGPGLDAEQEAHIFEPFFTTEKVGTGLGLFLCKELCEANQARLEWLPPSVAPSTGCRFRILFAHPKRHQLDES